MKENILFQKDWPNYFVFVSAILLSVLCIIFGSFYYPIAGPDTIFFIPPAINFYQGNGLINQIAAEHLSAIDTSGQNRFLYYPPFFPILLSLFADSDASGIFIFLGFLSALSILLSALILCKYLIQKSGRLSWLGAIFIFLALITILRMPWGSSGRPEIFARFLISIAFLLFCFLSYKKYWQIFGVILGLLIITHPVEALIFGVLLGLVFSIQESTKTTLFLILKILALASVVVFIFIQFFSPIDINELITGLARHWFLKALTGSGFINFFSLISNTHSLFYGVIFIFLVLIGIKTLKSYFYNIKSRELFIVFLAILFLITVYFSIINVRNYYITPFSVIIFAVFGYYIFVLNHSHFLKWAAVFIFLVLSFTSLREVVLFPFYVKDGVDLENARKIFETIVKRDELYLNIEITKSLWLLNKDLNTIKLIPDDYNIKSENPLLIFWQQENIFKSKVPPLAIRGCPLLENYFNMKEPVIFNIKLSDITPGYGFAVYKCQ